MSNNIAALKIALETKKLFLESLQEDLREKEAEISGLELDSDDFIDAYENMLDDGNEGYHGWSHSYILKELDPIAYRCGLVDYVDSLAVEDHHEDYDQLEGEREDLDSAIQDLESEIEDLENEIEDAENEE